MSSEQCIYIDTLTFGFIDTHIHIIAYLHSSMTSYSAITKTPFLESHIFC